MNLRPHSFFPIVTAPLFLLLFWSATAPAADSTTTAPKPLVDLVSPDAANSVGAIAPRPLIDLSSPDASKQVRPNNGDPEYTIDKAGISVSLPAARAGYPGIQVIPANGGSWDLSPFGHIEAKITNTGTSTIRLTMRVDSQDLRNTEVIGVRPGESKVAKVIFGYDFGFHPGKQTVDSTKVTLIILCLDKSDKIQSFRVEDLQGAGPAGEKPPFNPDYVLTKPVNGIILGKGVTFDPAKQVVAKGAQVSTGPDGNLAVNLAGGKEEVVTVKPAMGAWDLKDANQIRVKFKNIGATAVTPTVILGSNSPNKTSSKKPIAPGAETEIVASFIPEVATVGPKEVLTHNGEPLPGTGTKYASNHATEINIIFDSTPGAKSLLITSIIADAPAEDVPSWVGKRPPVDGDWIQTFDEEFDGPTLDYKKWNIYGNNPWDKRTHFSKDNLILKDGKAILLYEKKTGFQNDDPNNKETGRTDYASGFLNTYGKWTQRYGYFESRMKLPTAPGLWPAFWLMPDRGINTPPNPQWGIRADRDTTKNGGMEFDIMEFLSGWGIYRFNVACHWDGYGKAHKAVGSVCTYVHADKEGFITVGLLWTPGTAVVYNNGREVFRWENPRVANVQEYIMYDLVSGGWDNLPLDNAKLPDGLTIDYVRVWQRKDLATPEDGPKPNNGIPDERNN